MAEDNAFVRFAVARLPAGGATGIGYLGLIAARLKEVFGPEVAFEGERDHPPWNDSARDSPAVARLAAQTERNELRLALGQHTGLLTELPALTAAHPLDERVARQFVLARLWPWATSARTAAGRPGAPRCWRTTPRRWS